MCLLECDCSLDFVLARNGHLAIELVDCQFAKMLVLKMKSEIR